MLSMIPLAALTMSQLAFSKAFRDTEWSMLTCPSVSRAASSLANLIAWCTSLLVALNLSKHCSPVICRTHTHTHEKWASKSHKRKNYRVSYFWPKNFDHYSNLVTVHHLAWLGSFNNVAARYTCCVTVTVAVVWFRERDHLSLGHGWLDRAQMIQSVQFQSDAFVKTDFGGAKQTHVTMQLMKLSRTYRNNGEYTHYSASKTHHGSKLFLSTSFLWVESKR